jgi:hypothetical protein
MQDSFIIFIPSNITFLLNSQLNQNLMVIFKDMSHLGDKSEIEVRRSPPTSFFFFFLGRFLQKKIKNCLTLFYFLKKIISTTPQHFFFLQCFI